MTDFEVSVRGRPVVSDDEYVVVQMREGRFMLRLNVDLIPLAELKGFRDERWIDHSKIGVRTEKGSGLDGGGDATEVRSLRFDLGNLPRVKEVDSQAFFPVAEGRATVLQLNVMLDHDKLVNMREAQHVDHKKVGIEPGVGLDGGGDATEVRVLRLALSSLESYVPARSASIPFVDVDKTHGKMSFEKLFELFRDWLKEEANAI